MTIAEIIVTALVVLATICVVATTILQLRAPDALTPITAVWVTPISCPCRWRGAT